MLTAAALATLTVPTMCAECHQSPSGLVVECERCHVPIHARCFADTLTPPEVVALECGVELAFLCAHCRS